MCGIAGWLGAQHESETLTLPQRMVEVLHHRGPDARGIRSWPEATLLHTRLSIIDLTPSGAQPMANEDRTIWTVFNGEIYNHTELRHELEAKGHVFRGRSDTEVLPHLYEEDGSSFAAKLRGMFALAIYDTRSQTLTLARDRFGIKPLFYAASSAWLLFASELRALLCHPAIDPRPDRQAIYDYAALGFIPAPQTCYASIRALQPGEILEAQWDGTEVRWIAHAFHRWTIAPDVSMTLTEAADRAGALVMEATRRQLESDVPLGALLSGGIDSSLVSVAAQTALHDRLRTFNVRFAEQEYDETWAAAAVAEHIDSRHQTLDMNAMPGTWEHVTSLLRHTGQPFADISLFAVNAICRLMRQHVTVALSGDGGDEGFGGYKMYWRIATIARWQHFPPSLWRGASTTLSRLAPLGIVPERLPRQLAELAGADHPTIIQNLLCWVRAVEHKALCRDTDVLPVRRLFEPQWEYGLSRQTSRLERLSALATEVGLRLILPNDFLFKVDTASMRESLEVRVPMLDEDLIAFGLCLPHNLKAEGHTCKRVLREVAKRYLPPTVAKKPKQGFRVPVDSWVDADFKTCLGDALLGPSSRLPEFFRPEVYRPILEAFCQRRPYPGISREGLYQRAIMLLSVQLTLDEPYQKRLN